MTVHQAAEEAARLYAGGGSTEARAILEREVRSEFSGSERLWLMLLTLYEETGERRLFDKLAQDFAIRFKRSTPVWRGQSTAPVDAMQSPGGNVTASLAGRISAASAPEIDRFRAFAERNRDLRIDLSRLKGMDPAGCAMLLELLQAIRKRGGDAMISGDDAMLRALAKATQARALHVPPALWMLHLELLQWRDRQAEFEKVAIDYATTFAAAPPSFELLMPASTPPSGARQVPAMPPGALATPGEIESQSDLFFEALAAYAATRSLVQVNLSGLKRIDFWAVARLFGVASQLKTQSKRLELLWPNALVAEWLEATGVTAVSRIVPRPF